MKKVLLGFVVLFGTCMAIELGQVPPLVTIEGDDGGITDGKIWSSSVLKGKVHVLFYVDPDEKDLNNAFADALKAKKFSKNKFNSVAIINLAATWLPNAMIELKLREKQKKFPDTIYVKDKKKILVKQWQLADDNSDILIFNKKGELIYKKFGKVSDAEIIEVIKLIEKNI